MFYICCPIFDHVAWVKVGPLAVHNSHSCIHFKYKHQNFQPIGYQIVLVNITLVNILRLIATPTSVHVSRYIMSKILITGLTWNTSAFILCLPTWTIENFLTNDGLKAYTLTQIVLADLFHIEIRLNKQAFSAIHSMTDPSEKTQLLNMKKPQFIYNGPLFFHPKITQDVPLGYESNWSARFGCAHRKYLYGMLPKAAWSKPIISLIVSSPHLWN